MIGLSSGAKAAIHEVVEEIFDRLALQMVGDIPRLRNKKIFMISTRQTAGLASLFVQAMGNRAPNAIERDALKSLLESSHGFIESLKAKTRSTVTERIDAIAREAKIKGELVPESAVEAIIQEELSRAGTHLKTIAESESTKLRNLGGAMDITRVAAGLGDEDPTVFFIVIRDGATCKECKRLHLNEDGTPKVWKFSELKQGYHKRGEDSPSAFGLHPHCRCTLTYLSKGFGFDKSGKVTWVGQAHDEHSRQRSR
jgi:hypothetical protein